MIALLSILNPSNVLAVDGTSMALDANFAYTVCLVIGLIFLVASIICFFAFNITQIFMIKTGKGAQKAIKKMNDVNAATGRLRNANHSYDNYVKSESEGSAPTGEKVSSRQSKEIGKQKESSQKRKRNDTSVLEYDGTTVLRGQSQSIKHGDVGVGKFEIVYNLTYVHTNERV